MLLLLKVFKSKLKREAFKKVLGPAQVWKISHFFNEGFLIQKRFPPSSVIYLNKSLLKLQVEWHILASVHIIFVNLSKIQCSNDKCYPLSKYVLLLTNLIPPTLYPLFLKMSLYFQRLHVFCMPAQCPVVWSGEQPIRTLHSAQLTNQSPPNILTYQLSESFILSTDQSGPSSASRWRGVWGGSPGPGCAQWPGRRHL